MDLTLAGAFLTGAVTSVHCAGMCGPLACGVGSMAKTDAESMAAGSLYHVGRMIAYGSIGAICGAVGKEPLSWFFHSPAVLLPWALVGALLVAATRLDKKIPFPGFLVKWGARMRFKAGRLPVLAGAGLMGLMTPFLPCGPLYALFLALMTAGSAIRGAETAVAFSLGTVPLLWLAQRQWLKWKLRLSPIRMAHFQRGLALVAALVLAWRLHGTLPPFHSSTAVPSPVLPSCCEGESPRPH